MNKGIIPLSIGGLGIGITEFVMMGLLPDIALDLNISIPEAGHLISAYALGVVIGAPLLIMLGGKYPAKTILITLMVMFTVFNALSALSPNYTILFIIRLLAGLPHGAFFGVGSVVASQIAPKGKETQAISMMFMGLTLANILGVPLGTFVGHNLSWRIPFILVVVVGLVCLWTLKVWLPSTGSMNDGEEKQNELLYFKKKEAWIIMLMISIGFGGLFAWFSYISPLMTEVSGFSAENVTFILILAGLGMTFGNYMGAKLADKFSPVKTTIGLFLTLAIVLMGVFFLSENKIVSLILTFATAAVSFALAPAMQMIMIQSAKGSEMLAASVGQGCFNIGNALGAFLGGLPLFYGFAYTWPSLVGAPMALIGCLFAIWLVNKNTERTNTLIVNVQS